MVEGHLAFKGHLGLNSNEVPTSRGVQEFGESVPRGSQPQTNPWEIGEAWTTRVMIGEELLPEGELGPI